MNLVVTVPIAVRLGLLFVLGACAGSLVNWAVYRLAFRQRSISPWSAPAKGAPPRRGSDRIPIVGWLGLRRESPLHGSWFWLRPMLVELLVGLGCAWLYWWEIDQQGLLPLRRPVNAALFAMLHAQYVGHMVLILLMTAASLIDADEKTIPDAITLSGTLFGLAWATLFPWALLPIVQRLPNGLMPVQFLNITSPHPWPAWMNGFPQPWSLVIALGCWWLWCLGLLPRRWYSRHGWWRALGLLFARLARDLATRWILLMGLVGSAGIAGVWTMSGDGDRWKGLLSALVGMAASAAMIWAVRIVGGATMGREAMGFGDVTLMAMVGTLLGWQTGLLIFFAAPLIAIGVGLLSVILHREHEIPYGPFLCMAALLAIVRWADVWAWAKPQVFMLGLWVPGALVVCLALMPLLLLGVLLVVDLARRLLFGRTSDEQ